MKNSNHKLKIITISGLDGSGKSTQVDLIKEHLESQGKKVYYFHAVQYSLVNKIIRALKSPLVLFGILKQKEGRSVSKVSKANRWQLSLRRFILKMDIVRFDTLCANLTTGGYDYIISDRYFYDNAINIEYLTAKLNPDFHDSNLLGLKDMIVKPNIAIYLQAEPKAIMERERTPDQGIVYLELKKNLFDKKTEIIDWKVINGNRSKEQVFEEIKNLI
ncbi:dTMP kinase [Patescibacteria group bacterium]